MSQVQGTNGPLCSSNLSFPSQDARHNGLPWGPTNSPMPDSALTHYRRELQGLATSQQLSHCMGRLQEMTEKVQQEKAKAAQIANSHGQLEVKIRDMEQELSNKSQRLHDIADYLKNTSESLSRAELLSKAQWSTVADLTGFLRTQIVDGREIDVSSLFHEKETMKYELENLKDSLSDKQAQLDRKTQDLESTKADNEITRTTLESALAVKQRNIDNLASELSATAQRLQQLDRVGEQWSSVLAAKDTEISRLHERLSAWESQPKVGPVPQRKYAGRNVR